MPEIGQSLSHYKIIEKIGKGGMGEVYRARDQKLARDVAIKVLPEEFARDADRVARFQREAKLLASLNHPNIAAIYGLEEFERTNFLVMELVEGETLADQIKRGPIPAADALKLALQIAEALESAHEKGVIHRDLKPANIKVTPESTVKVLDFGLAKAYTGEHAELSFSNSPTLSDMATRQGVILGTAAYMSPEQARGKAVDKRADIWAFGCVLLEMLTGQEAWSGNTITDTIAAVLIKTPAFNLLPPNIHKGIPRLLERCLEKDPMDRLRDAGDIRIEIKHILDSEPGSLPEPDETPARRTTFRSMVPWIAGMSILGMIFGCVAAWMWKRPPPVDLVESTYFDYVLPDMQELGGRNLTVPMLAVSPDGRQLAYCTHEGIYLRSFEEMDSKPIPGTGKDPQQPFFSPDGQWIGYWSSADRELKKIRIKGGNPIPLTKESAAGFYTWTADDTIIYSTARQFKRIDPNSGKSEVFLDAKNSTVFTPRFLPGGKAVIFTISTTEGYKIAVQSIDSDTPKILRPGSDPYYCPTGHLIYVLDKDIVAIPFDTKVLDTKGVQIPIVKGVLRTTGVPQFAVGDSGTLAYLSESANTTPVMRTLHWVNRNGKEESLGADPMPYRNPRISPLGNKLVLSIGSEPTININIWDLSHGGYLMPRTNEESINTLPIWAGDNGILFFRRTLASFEICRVRAGGDKQIESIHSLQNIAVMPECWATQGKTLLVTATPLGSEYFEMGTLSVEGRPEYRPFTKQRHSELQPQISPDGRWIAYTSDESGQYEVWVRPYPQGDKDPSMISGGHGGDSPLWSPIGHELFYRSGDKVMAIEVIPTTKDSEFQWKSIGILFEGKYISSELRTGSSELHPWDISPDGKRFLMMKDSVNAKWPRSGARKISIVLNWFDKLRQLVPTN